MNLDELLNHFHTHRMLEEQVREIARAIGNHRKIFYHTDGGCIDSIEYNEHQIVVNFSEYYRGDTDHNDVEFPYEYLLLDNYMEIEGASWAAKCKAAHEAAVIEEEARKLRIKQEAEARERAVYEELRKKYA